MIGIRCFFFFFIYKPIYLLRLLVASDGKLKQNGFMTLQSSAYWLASGMAGSRSSPAVTVTLSLFSVSWLFIFCFF